MNEEGDVKWGLTFLANEETRIYMDTILARKLDLFRH